MLSRKIIRSSQSGATLLEALVAIFIFSIGILALVALQAAAIKESIDAKYRSDASYLANQIIAQMWVDRAHISEYQHYSSGSSCAFSGSASSNTNVTNWVTEASRLLPGISNNKLQIAITTPIANTYQVKVTVCWEINRESTSQTRESAVHNFTATAHINQ